MSATDLGTPGAAGPGLTAWLVVPGRLVPYRGFVDPGRRNRLLRFEPEGPLDPVRVALVQNHVRPTGTGTDRVRILGQRARPGQAPLPVLITNDAPRGGCTTSPTPTRPTTPGGTSPSSSSKTSAPM